MYEGGYAGIEELYVAGDRYVYWRGKQFEHWGYSGNDPFDQPEKWHKHARKVAREMRHYEKLGVDPIKGYMYSELFKTTQPGDPWIPIFSWWSNHTATNGRQHVFYYRNTWKDVYLFDGAHWRLFRYEDTDKQPDLALFHSGPWGYHWLKQRGFGTPNVGQGGYAEDGTVAREGANIGVTKPLHQKEHVMAACRLYGLAPDQWPGAVAHLEALVPETWPVDEDAQKVILDELGISSVRSHQLGPNGLELIKE